MIVQNWLLNSETEVVVDVPVERLWTALIADDDARHYFMGARVSVGEEGEAYRVAREDGWGATGIVLAKEAPRRLRMTWGIKAPPGVTMPNCEVEYAIEPVVSAQAGARAKLTIREYVDGPIPPEFAKASRTGWSMIARSLKAYLG
ncbi:MAG: SRPBCC domain-containing protein [Rhizobiales bacterium]|nr:SRPBCC domain-containing protein [Hyphomicrobiales bacterium]